MAGTRSQLWVVILALGIVLLSLAWSCEAYNQNRQEPKGEFTRVHNLGHNSVRKSDARHGGRILAESRSGWRATLVHENHRFQSLHSLSSMEKIARIVRRTTMRSRYFTQKMTQAPYKKVSGRKTLAVDDVLFSSPHRSILQMNESFESPIVDTSGAYSMAFSIGTPAQNFVAIADTGSDLVWLQCADCSPCFSMQADTPFDPSLSTSYAPLGCTAACDELGSNRLSCTPECQYTYKYGDQSTTIGNFALETLHLNTTNGTTLDIAEFGFGCGLRNQGTFQGTDGLVGLARGQISFPSQIASFLGSNKFSYCLVADLNATDPSPIIFGEAAVPANASGVVYTPQQTPYEASVIPFYYVTLNDITVGGEALNIPSSVFAIDTNGNGGVIFDSGTTLTVLVTDAYTAVVNALDAQIQYTRVDLSSQVGLDVCYDVSAYTTVSYPPLVFKFEGADFKLEFENTFLVVGSSTQTFMCLAMSEGQGISIIGSTQQQGFQVVYDEDNLQIGWVPEDCTTL